MQSLFDFNIYGNVLIVSSFFSTRALSVQRRLIKCIRTNYVKKKLFFHLSVIDLFNFSKNSNDTGST